MAKDTVTLVLNGEVTLDDYAKAVTGWVHLMNALTADVANGAPVRWVVDDLQYGSAMATARGVYGEVEAEEESPDETILIESIVDAYEEVGTALQRGEEIRFSPRVIASAREITSVINGHIKSIRFETESTDAQVFAPPQAVTFAEANSGSAGPQLVEESYGAVRGRIQSLTNRKQLRFTLYDVNTDHAVSCYLEPGSEQMMRESWGKLAIVEGVVRRDPTTGQPTTIRQVKSDGIKILAEGNRTAYRSAIGIAPAKPDSISPEAAIRRVRDA